MSRDMERGGERMVRAAAGVFDFVEREGAQVGWERGKGGIGFKEEGGERG